MKKFISSFIIVAGLFVLFGFYGVVQASTTTPKLFLDGKQIVTDVDPIIQKGTTLVPLAVLSSGLGYNVKWDNANQVVTVLDSKVTIKLTIGEKLGYVNDTSYELSQAPSLLKNRTMVPIRFVSEVLGLKVQWKQQTAEVLLTSPVKEPEPTPIPTPTSPATQNATIQHVSVNSDGQLSIGYTGTINNPKTMVLPGDSSNPTRLVIDLADTGYTYELANSFIKGQSEFSLEGYSTITGYRFSQFKSSPLEARIVVLLKEGTKYQVSNGASEVIVSFYDANTELPEPTPTPTPLPGETPLPEVTPPPAVDDANRIYHIVLDAGHGKSDPGAINKSLSLFEKDFNLAAVLKLKTELEKNKRIKVHLTRSDDTFLELDARVAFAEKIPGLGVKADIFISMHANSFTNTTVNGSETYYTKENSKALANAIHPYLVRGMGLNDRGVRTASFKVIRETTMPAVLIEAGYISNNNDAKALFDTKVQGNMAKEVATGIIHYLKL